MARKRRSLALLLAGSAWILTTSCWPSPSKTPPPVEGFISQPERRDFSIERLNQLQVPEGFQAPAFATGLGNVRMLVQADDGTVYGTRRETGDVIALKDDRLYLAPPIQVLVAEIQSGVMLATPSEFVGGLPNGGQHPNRTIAFGPDGKFYITIGSTCNECDEPNPDHAAIHRTNADGPGRTLYAKGLRNTIGFDWHPATKELWGMDHGSDWRGDNHPPEELNQIVQDGNYG